MSTLRFSIFDQDLNSCSWGFQSMWVLLVPKDPQQFSTIGQPNCWGCLSLAIEVRGGSFLGIKLPIP